MNRIFLIFFCLALVACVPTNRAQPEIAAAMVMEEESAVSPLEGLATRGLLDPVADFRWVDLEAARPRMRCASGRFLAMAGMFTSGRFDDRLSGLRTAASRGASGGGDMPASVPVNFDPETNGDLFEVTLPEVGVQALGAMCTEAGRARIVELVDYLAEGGYLPRVDAADGRVSDLWLSGFTRIALAYVAVAPYVDIDPERRARIEAWIDDRMGEVRPVTWSARTRCTRTPVSGPLQNDNCAYLEMVAAHAIMVWGAHKGDRQMLNQGPRRYYDFLRAMRPDGSLPEDARRGCRALLYSGQTLGLMTQIAELARRHGRNIFDESVRGNTIHDGIAFLLAAEGDPGLIAAYTAGPPAGSVTEVCAPGGQIETGSAVAQATFWPYALWNVTPEADQLRGRLGRAGTEDDIYADTVSYPFLWARHPG